MKPAADRRRKTRATCDPTGKTAALVGFSIVPTESRRQTRGR